jgi:hypothetical protein
MEGYSLYGYSLYGFRFEPGSLLLSALDELDYSGAEYEQWQRLLELHAEVWSYVISKFRLYVG